MPLSNRQFFNYDILSSRLHNVEMRLFLVSFMVLVSFICSANAAEQKQKFVQYFDCLRSTVTPLVDIDVFMKIQGKGNKSFRSASEYTQGVDIDLVLNDRQEVLGLTLQHPYKTETDAVVSVEDLKAGLQFGVLNKTFHTIELAPDFDPKTGGTLIMGTMTDLPVKSLVGSFVNALKDEEEPDSDLKEAQRKYPNLGLSEKLAKHYSETNSNRWIQEKFKVVKEDGRWVLKNSDGNLVDTVFVEMKIPFTNVPIVTGLTKIESVFMSIHNKCVFANPEEVLLQHQNKEKVQLMTVTGQNQQPPVRCKRD